MAFSLKEDKFSEVIMVLSSYHMFKYCYAVRSYFMDNRLAPWLDCKCVAVRDHELWSLFYQASSYITFGIIACPGKTCLPTDITTY